MKKLILYLLVFLPVYSNAQWCFGCTEKQLSVYIFNSRGTHIRKETNAFFTSVVWNDKYAENHAFLKNGKVTSFSIIPYNKKTVDGISKYLSSKCPNYSAPTWKYIVGKDTVDIILAELTYPPYNQSFDFSPSEK